jgi:hypothetical protein
MHIEAINVLKEGKGEVSRCWRTSFGPKKSKALMRETQMEALAAERMRMGIYN